MKHSYLAKKKVCKLCMCVRIDDIKTQFFSFSPSIRPFMIFSYNN